MRTRITVVAGGLVLIVVMTTAGGGTLTGAAIDAGVGAAAGPVCDWSR